MIHFALLVSTGEEIFFRRFPEQVHYHVMGEGFTWETQDRQRDIAAAEAAWEVSREMLRDPAIGLVVLDELNIPSNTVISTSNRC